MTARLQVYKCEICGNIVEVLHSGRGQLVCCGQPMTPLEEKTEEQGREKHLPVTERADQSVTVKVGGVPHPMEEKHYVEWVEIVMPDSVARTFLKPGEAPEAVFGVVGDVIQVRVYCNIHGLWTQKEA